MEKDRFLLFSSCLSEAQKSIARIKQKKMEHYGLASAHAICICQLEEHADGLTKTELSQICMVDKAQISRVISDVVKKGYVAVSATSSRYRKKYFLTEYGRKIAGEIRKTILDINSFVSMDIPQEDIDKFYATFNIICENLNKAEKIF
ncbi:MAG: hypothetical protein J6V42_05985 [Clostridia bacterium]|nr:hypothetical protein [Clostridia bacterium]